MSNNESSGASRGPAWFLAVGGLVAFVVVTIATWRLYSDHASPTWQLCAAGIVVHLLTWPRATVRAFRDRQRAGNAAS